MVVVLTELLCFFGLEEQVPCKHFIHHASQRPDVSSGVEGLPQDYFRRSILTSLNLAGEMVMQPACIT